MHSELSYGLSIAPKLQRVGSIHIQGWDQPTPDPSFSPGAYITSMPHPFFGAKDVIIDRFRLIIDELLKS